MHVLIKNNMAAVRRALEGAGIKFIDRSDARPACGPDAADAHGQVASAASVIA